MMPVVTAVSICPTCAVPVIPGAPVAGLLVTAAALTAAVAALVRGPSAYPSLSLKPTFTLIVLPWSAPTSV